MPALCGFILRLPRGKAGFSKTYVYMCADTVRIVSAAWLHDDRCKLQLSTGAVFFIRTAYLAQLKPEDIAADQPYTEDGTQDLIQAGFAYAAEQAAHAYLERSEHSRHMLERKLAAKKQFDGASIQKALDYLETRDILSDSRFARAWLHARTAHKAESRRRLAAELAARGVSTRDAEAALDELFSDISEEELCRRAAARRRRSGKSDDAIRRALCLQGFPARLAARCLSEDSSDTERQISE